MPWWEPDEAASREAVRDPGDDKDDRNSRWWDRRAV